MRAGICFFITLMAIACASHRERRQSAYAGAHTQQHTRRDTAWLMQQQGAHTVQLMEVEEWFRCTGRPIGSTFRSDSNTVGSGRSTLRSGRNTVPTGRNTTSAGSSYRRTRSITFRSDSNTVSSGRSTIADSVYTGWTESNTDRVKRKTDWFIGYAWWIGIALVLAGLAYTVYRKVLR